MTHKLKTSEKVLFVNPFEQLKCAIPNKAFHLLLHFALCQFKIALLAL